MTFQTLSQELKLFLYNIVLRQKPWDCVTVHLEIKIVLILNYSTNITMHFIGTGFDENAFQCHLLESRWSKFDELLLDLDNDAKFYCQFQCENFRVKEKISWCVKADDLKVTWLIGSLTQSDVRVTPLTPNNFKPMKPQTQRTKVFKKNMTISSKLLIKSTIDQFTAINNENLLCKAFKL